MVVFLNEKHKRQLRFVLEIFRKNNTYANPNKGEFLLIRVGFLGHVLGHAIWEGYCLCFEQDYPTHDPELARVFALKI